MQNKQSINSQTQLTHSFRNIPYTYNEIDQITRTTAFFAYISFIFEFKFNYHINERTYHSHTT